MSLFFDSYEKKCSDKQGLLKSFYTERGIFKSELLIHKQLKVKVFPHTLIRKGVPVREDTYPEPSACEVGWLVPVVAAFISPVFP